ncbi:MAG TPA: MucR family transcriptional regulator [Sphingobium sp.]|uniref:MucR family transcriptional regulator n=1 Tax=Sphingobium sp. TaxID=1912891 RepID=UPI002ED164D5
MADTEQPDVTAFTVQLLSAYLANNEVAHTELAELIRTTRHALVGEPAPSTTETVTDAIKPAVSIRKSLASPDFILSLIDGKPYKTLKRHLTTHGLTPQAYRERYKLPADYPMVAPGFAEQRRLIANKIGLGRRISGPAATAAQPSEASAVPSDADAAAPPAQAVTAPTEVKAPKAKAAKGSAQAKSAAKPAAKAVSRAAKPKAAANAVAVSAIPTEPTDAQDVTGQAAAVSDRPAEAQAVAAATKKVEPTARPRAARGTLKLFGNGPSEGGVAKVATAKPSTAAKPKAAKAKSAVPGKASKSARKSVTSDAPKD